MNRYHNNQLPPGFHAASNEIKAINTLYGLIMGITADQVINDNEIHFLNLWLKDNEAYTRSFPLNVVKQRIDDILADNIITQEEREDFYQTLSKLIGGTFQETGAAGGFSTSFGNQEPDELIVNGSTFCLTGAFITGTRDKCEQIITELGGIPAKSVTKKLDYLVIGALASRDWIATSHGRKIEKALLYQEQGSPVTILCEESWAKFINITN
ncbi:BRCT domain-containing protein [Methylobacter tundripaludum]|uniref:BRCT domain protein n=1 Tax=Methylobacter tundripaludum (strain ATCC BAA-1195 / DSM 17260 / SV96) TaxID=697282 RepID=G3IRC5_METTV|nr:BRCT domain-containing protein [Methylobacter tundripaludum]EGW22136.1 BRCT domain protein [Methylobacter tundripaludum SV96]